MKFAVVIPAHNEEGNLPALLDSLDEALGDAPAHITVDRVVVDNASTDGTAALAQGRGCRVIQVGKRVISAVKNAGAHGSVGDMLLFVDADERVSKNLFGQLCATLERGDVLGGVSGIKLERRSLGILATFTLLAPLICLTHVPAGVIFCRRSAFEAIGGFNENLLHSEDIALIASLRNLALLTGCRFCRLKGARTIHSLRKFDRHGDWHLFWTLPSLAVATLLNRSRAEKIARDYWYDL